MNNEVNTTPSEYNTPIDSMEAVGEFPSAALSNDTLPDSSKSYNELNETDKSKKVATAFSKLLSAAAILAIVAAMILPSIGGASISAQFIALETTDTAVFYKIAVDNLSEGDDVSVVLYNDFTRRELAVDSIEAEGEIGSLKPNMSYTIAIKSGKKTIVKQTVRTKSQTKGE